MRADNDSSQATGRHTESAHSMKLRLACCGHIGDASDCCSSSNDTTRSSFGSPSCCGSDGGSDSVASSVENADGESDWESLATGFRRPTLSNVVHSHPASDLESCSFASNRRPQGAWAQPNRCLDCHRGSQQRVSGSFYARAALDLHEVQEDASSSVYGLEGADMDRLLAMVVVGMLWSDDE